MDIAIIGCGKIGACMAACYASGNNVKVYDTSASARKAMATGKGLPKEPPVDSLWQMNRDNITVCSDAKTAVRYAKLIFVIVPTPSKSDGEFDQSIVLAALRPVAAALAESKQYQVIACNSTVTPGSSESEIIPLLESKIGKKCGNGWGYCYNPHFVAMGAVCSGLTTPDCHLIGQAGENEGETLHTFYSHMTGVRTIRMPVVSAEMAKLALNCALSVKAYFANMVAELCEKVPGANARDVLLAVGRDHRIGPEFMRAGPPPAGPCLPRDLRCFSAYAKRQGSGAALAEACMSMRREWVLNAAHELAKHSPRTVAILGVSYKPGIYLTDESPALEVAALLASKGIKVLLHDPYDRETDPLDECLRADAVFLHTAHPEYVELDSMDIPASTEFLDGWGCLDSKKMREKCIYRVFGGR